MVTLKGGRVLLEEEAVANPPDHRVLDRAAQGQVQGVTKRGRKLQRAQVAPVVLAVVVLKDLVPKRVKTLRHRANLCRVWHPNMGGTLVASLAKGVLEVRVLQQVREDRVVLQSKAVVAQANPVVAPSKGSPVVRAVPRLKGMIGSLEVLPRTSPALVLQKPHEVIAKPIELNIS
jgi:hypothetical protein